MTLRWARSPVAAEQDEDERIGHPLEAEALAERVVDALVRRALAACAWPARASRRSRIVRGTSLAGLAPAGAGAAGATCGLLRAAGRWRGGLRSFSSRSIASYSDPTMHEPSAIRAAAPHLSRPVWLSPA